MRRKVDKTGSVHSLGKYRWRMLEIKVLRRTVVCKKVKVTGGEYLHNEELQNCHSLSLEQYV
jgi:hypothetical protein